MVGKQVMITVNWDGTRVSVNPDPAYVNLGDAVTWALLHDGEPLACTVYFAHGSPFAFTDFQFSQVSGAVMPSQEGEWKYGVRLQRAATTLADDDPHLVVQH